MKEVFEVGDQVLITKSKRNWCPDMDQYVGKIAKLTQEIGRSYKIDLDEGSWSWSYREGHFIDATDKHKPSSLLEDGDKVKFTIIRNESIEIYQYVVRNKYLNYNGDDNDIIFDMLSIDKEAFCTIHYGYDVKGGTWPECKPNDYAALTRTVNALQEACNIKNRTTIDLHGLYK